MLAHFITSMLLRRKQVWTKQPMLSNYHKPDLLQRQHNHANTIMHAHQDSFTDLPLALPVACGNEFTVHNANLNATK
eukprot:m.166081 g.166081  ORF g.166081 m.166081 type:complete len:77 (+) comp14440_c0_seq1:1038-1268(+)